jgi:hypothetical protein
LEEILIARSRKLKEPVIDCTIQTKNKTSLSRYIQPKRQKNLRKIARSKLHIKEAPLD